MERVKLDSVILAIRQKDKETMRKLNLHLHLRLHLHFTVIISRRMKKHR
jgi:hypothetical protein